MQQTQAELIAEAPSQHHQRLARKAIAALTGINARFHVRLDDGTELGEPIEKQLKRLNKGSRTRGPNISKGITKYVRDRISGMEIGQRMLIEPGDYLPERITSCTSAVAFTLWGKGNFSSSLLDTNQTEVIRLE